MNTYATGKQVELDELGDGNLAELLRKLPASKVTFCRIEKGEQCYRIDCTDDNRQLPKGKQVLIS